MNQLDKEQEQKYQALLNRMATLGSGTGTGTTTTWSNAHGSYGLGGSSLFPAVNWPSPPYQTPPPSMQKTPALLPTSIMTESDLTEMHIARAAIIRLLGEDGLIVSIKRANGDALGHFTIGTDDQGKTFILSDLHDNPNAAIDDHTQLIDLQLTVRTHKT